MKTKILLIAAVMFLALSVSAFAQSAYTVSQETLDRVACCGLAEPTGAIAFTAVADTPASVTGTITLRYNLPITNVGTQDSNADRVRVVATNNVGTQLSPQPTWIAANDNSNGIITIAVPAGYTYPTTIKVFNVRVDVSASALCGSTDAAVTATASSTGNFLTIGETTSVTLVKGVAKALKTPVVTVAPSGTVVTVNAANGAVTGDATIKIDENFITAFGINSTFSDPNRTQQTLIRLTVSAIPTGLTVTFPGPAGIFGTANSAGTFSGSPVVLGASTTPQNVYYVMTAASNPAGTDSLLFSPTVAFVENTPVPLVPGTITVRAAMAPITTTPSVIDRFPLFIEGCETDAVNLVTISGAKNTVLLVPYASEEVGYHTALTVANTTLDPGTVAMGNYLQAIPQAGKLTVYFFPKDGGTIAPWVSTSAPSEFGLDATGKVPAGGTFVCLLSEILPATVESFSGYLFIVTDFTNGHGEYFISDFDNFTHGALMLVVNEVRASGRTVEQGLNQ